MIDRIRRLSAQGRLGLYWWVFNIGICAVLIVFAMRG